MFPKAANSPTASDSARHLADGAPARAYHFRRLLGQETEYAIRFRSTAEPAGSPGSGRPGHSRVFQAFRYAIRRIVKTRPGEWLFFLENFFTENGGAFNYEALPYAPEAGLVEGATPECHSPHELLLYQRAQEALLMRAKPDAQRYLERRGHPGELGLIKNCRDAEGHIYGAQESYEVEIARGWRLLLLRGLAAVSLLPLLLWWVAYLLLISALVVVALLVPAVAWLVYGALYLLLGMPGWLRRWRTRVELWLARVAQSERLHRLAAWSEFLLVYPFTYIVVLPYGLALHALAFRRERRLLSAFLISRPVLSGAGTLLDPENGSFALSEKATALRRIFRLSISPAQRSLFDSGNLHKSFLLAGFSCVLLRPASLGRIFQRRTRLQIGMSDANRAQVAELLKTGTMVLVLDAAEAGYLKGAPRLKRARKALRIINNDPTLSARVPLRGGRSLNAIEIQQEYLAGVQQYLASFASVDPRAQEIVRLWSETLQALQSDPGQLIGRLDWVSKRYLLETAGRGIEPAACKRIDIGYHELGCGFFDSLESRGLAPQIWNEAEIAEAIHRPSSPDRVQLRSRMIRGLVFGEKRVQISWNSVRIGHWWNQRVISLDAYRSERERSE